jgi:hypothetical protein
MTGTHKMLPAVKELATMLIAAKTLDERILMVGFSFFTFFYVLLCILSEEHVCRRDSCLWCNKENAAKNYAPGLG